MDSSYIWFLRDLLDKYKNIHLALEEYKYQSFELEKIKDPQERACLKSIMKSFHEGNIEDFIKKAEQKEKNLLYTVEVLKKKIEQEKILNEELLSKIRILEEQIGKPLQNPPSPDSENWTEKSSWGGFN